MYSFNNFTRFIISFYVILNILAYLRILYLNELIGDFVGFPFEILSLNISLFLVVISYYLIIKFVFIIYRNININKSLYEINIQNKVGYLILLIQTLFVAYFITSGTRIAGSSYKDSSIWSIFWVLLPADSLFLIYYSLTEKKSAIYYFNLIIAIISNILRGWSGIFFIIFYFELFFIFSKRKSINIYKIIMTLICLIIIYPFIFLFKLYLRDYLINGFNLDNILLAFHQTFQFISNSTLYNIYSEYSIFSIIDRIQLVSNLTGVIDNLVLLNNYLSKDIFYPFWMDGLHGIAIDRILGYAPRESIGSAIGYLISNDQSATFSWVVNSSLVAWFFIDPFLSIFFTVYILFLILFSIYLCKILTINTYSLNLIVFLCLFYLIPGWLMVFSIMIYSLFIFIILTKFTRFLK